MELANHEVQAREGGTGKIGREAQSRALGQRAGPGAQETGRQLEAQGLGQKRALAFPILQEEQLQGMEAPPGSSGLPARG